MRVAIVGCGAIAEAYHLPALAARAGLMKHAILVDPDLTRARALAARFQANGVAAGVEAIRDAVDAAIVATPPWLHARVAIPLLARGVHVLCEKPLAESAQDASAMIEQAARSKAVFCINQTRRAFPAMRRVKELLDAGAIGECLTIEHTEGVRFTWRSAPGWHFAEGKTTGGVLLDQGAHVFDTICWWLGGTPSVVSCSTDSFGGPEGTASVVLRHHGCTVAVRLSWLSKLSNTYRIVGTRGVIEGGTSDWRRLTVAPNGERARQVTVGADRSDHLAFGGVVIDNFLNTIRGDAAPLAPAASVLPSVQLIDECYRCASRTAMPWVDTLPRQLCDPIPILLVTGGGGFIGTRVAEIVFLTRCACLRVGVRSWAGAARPARLPVDIVLCDVLDAGQVARAMRGVDVVVHCAVGDRRVIVDGTRNVLDAAARAGVERVIHMSTAEVYGGSVSGAIDETAPCTPGCSAYADAKIEAEQLVWEYGARGLAATIFRPSIVYGPWSGQWKAALAQHLQSGGRARYRRHGEGICNLVYVDDLVVAALSSIRQRRAIGQAFNVSGPDLLTWNEYFDRLNDALGLPNLGVRPASHPRAASTARGRVRAVAHMALSRYGDRLRRVYERGGWAAPIMKRTRPWLRSRPSFDEFDRLYSRKATYDWSKAARLLLYQPKFDLNRGLRLSVHWLRYAGLLTDGTSPQHTSARLLQ